MGTIKEETKDVRKILGRLKRRDFSGNTGQIVKNSTWQIMSVFIAKIGALFFSIIIARLLLPEVYGLYGLAISTILLIGVISDLGITQALSTFLSKKIDKNPGKAKGYFYYLTKYKFLLTLIASTVIIFLARWLSETYYQKPIYFALIAGAIYLPISTVVGYLSTIFTSKNNFKPQAIKEIIVQTLRIVLITILIIIFIPKIISLEFQLFWIFITLSICFLIGAIYLMIILKIKQPFKKAKPSPLTKSEKNDLLKFIVPLSIMGLSGVLFGYIDQIMLGHYVSGSFLGFYQASFNLIASASAIIAFSAIAAFPIFARLKGKQLERGFKKTMKITFLIAIAASIFTFLFSPIIIRIIYGTAYSISSTYLRILSILLISFPLASLYTSYYTSQKQTRLVAILIIISTILNIVLNFIFITIGIKIGMFEAVLGACFATIISRLTFLGGLIFLRRN